MTSSALTPEMGKLLAGGGFNPPYEAEMLRGGRNNRLIGIRAQDGSAVIKQYFQHEEDPRDRLLAEFEFCSFAWDHGIRSIPRPLAADRLHGLALYERIAGRTFRPEDITPARIRDALDFFKAINRFRHDEATAQLGDASDSCFSFSANLAAVSRRLEALTHIQRDDAADRAACELINRDVLPRWNAIAEIVPRHFQASGGDPAAILSLDQRCLSPSDFGFHNAMLDQDGHVRFIDFEYAGWDDPAKMIADFFCQPDLPVPLNAFERFATAVANTFENDPLVRLRTLLLLPVHQVKWVCIILNEFLPIEAERRMFAAHDFGSVERKSAQLHRAKEAISRIAMDHETITMTSADCVIRIP